MIFRKVTNGFRSGWGAKVYADLCSIVATGRLAGRSPSQPPRRSRPRARQPRLINGRRGVSNYAEIAKVLREELSSNENRPLLTENVLTSYLGGVWSFIEFARG